MERASPSARDVAAKILGRSKSGLVGSRRNNKEYVRTPSEDATPRTLIGGILDAASVSKSGLIAPRTRKSKLIKSPTTGPPAKRKKAIRQSLGDNATPRTIIKNFLMEASPETPLEVPNKLPNSQIIKNFLMEASPETPLEVPLKLPEKTVHYDSDTSSQPMPDVMQAPASSSQSDSATTENEISVHEIESLPDSEDSETPLAGELKEGYRAFLSKNSGNKDNEGAMVLSPPPENEEADIPKISPGQATESSTTTTNDEQDSHIESNSILVADVIIPSAVDTSSEPPVRSRWKDLKTPHLPIKRRNVLSEKKMVQDEDDDEVESKRTSKAVKKPPPGNKRTKTKNTSSSDTNLPSGLVKSIFQHFSKSRISRSTLNSIEKGSSLFFKQVSSDLMAYSNHAGRSTIEIGDVELLMKRQGFITDKKSLNSLIETFLPLEYRQELIPVVQSGNNVVLK